LRRGLAVVWLRLAFARAGRLGRRRGSLPRRERCCRCRYHWELDERSGFVDCCGANVHSPSGAVEAGRGLAGGLHDREGREDDDTACASSRRPRDRPECAGPLCVGNDDPSSWPVEAGRGLAGALHDREGREDEDTACASSRRPSDRPRCARPLREGRNRDHASSGGVEAARYFPGALHHGEGCADEDAAGASSGFSGESARRSGSLRVGGGFHAEGWWERPDRPPGSAGSAGTEGRFG
jgi:hypothetical protein